MPQKYLFTKQNNETNYKMVTKLIHIWSDLE